MAPGLQLVIDIVWYQVNNSSLDSLHFKLSVDTNISTFAPVLLVQWYRTQSQQYLYHCTSKSGANVLILVSTDSLKCKLSSELLLTWYHTISMTSCNPGAMGSNLRGTKMLLDPKALFCSVVFQFGPGLQIGGNSNSIKKSFRFYCNFSDHNQLP